MMDRGELPLEASDKKMSFGGAAPAEVAAPALEGAAAHEGVVSTSDTEAVFASWSRIVSEAGRVQAVESRETCGKLIFKRWEGEFPLWLSRLRTPASIHENSRLIPGLAQWVKDPDLLWPRSQMQLRSNLAIVAA